MLNNSLFFLFSVVLGQLSFHNTDFALLFLMMVTLFYFSMSFLCYFIQSFTLLLVFNMLILNLSFLFLITEINSISAINVTDTDTYACMLSPSFLDLLLLNKIILCMLLR